MLEQIFLIAVLPAWHSNALKRIVRTPKLHFVDSGLLATARGLNFELIRTNRTQFGALLEGYVFSEILKLMSVSDLQLEPHHFRYQETHEVDIVLERDDGMVAGIEVKASATVRTSDFSGLRTLADVCGDRFAYGAVLYDSTDRVPFGSRMAAVPVASLWA